MEYTLANGNSTNSKFLPEDIVHQIVRRNYFKVNNYFGINRKALCCYSLVARNWRRPAQSFLFHHVILTKRSAANQLKESLGGTFTSQIFYGEWLATRVRVLEVTIDYRGTGIPFEDLPSILSLFKNLYELRLRFVAVKSTQKQHLQVVENLKSSNSIPPIAALRLTIPIGVGVTTEVITNLLQVPWPIKYLQVDCKYLLAGIEGPNALPPPQYELLEFRSGGTNADTVSWILETSARTGVLKALHMPYNLAVSKGWRSSSKETGLLIGKAIHDTKVLYLTGSFLSKKHLSELYKFKKLEELGFCYDNSGKESLDLRFDKLSPRLESIRRVWISASGQKNDRWGDPKIFTDGFYLFSRKTAEGGWQKIETGVSIAGDKWLRSKRVTGVHEYPFQELAMKAQRSWPPNNSDSLQLPPTQKATEALCTHNEHGI